MTGTTMLLFGGSGSAAVTTTLTVGSYTVYSTYLTQNYYGYNNTTLGGLPQPLGDLSPTAFNGATILGLYASAFNAGNPYAYSVIFSGNRSAAFFSTLTVNGTLLAGTNIAPSFDGGTNTTSFVISPSVAAPCVWGTSGTATVILA